MKKLIIFSILILAACAPMPTATNAPSETPSLSPTETPIPPTPTPFVGELTPVNPDQRVDVGEGMTESLNDLKIDLGDGKPLQFEFASDSAKQKVKDACNKAGWATWMADRGAKNLPYVSFADWWAGVEKNDGKFRGAQELVHYKDHEGKDPKGIGFNTMGMTKPVEGEVDFNNCTLKIAGPAEIGTPVQFNGMILPGMWFGFTFDVNGNPRVALAMTDRKKYQELFYANPERTPAENVDAVSAMVATWVEDMNRLENAKTSAWKENSGVAIALGPDPVKDPVRVLFTNLAVSTYEIGKFLETDAPFLKLKK